MKHQSDLTDLPRTHSMGLADPAHPLRTPHLLTMAIDIERQEFFWSRVRREGTHLIWEGADTPRGYGKMTINGENVYAHRVAYCIAYNLDPKDIEDKQIIRTCEYNECVEPTHLTTKQKKVRKGS